MSETLLSFSCRHSSEDHEENLNCLMSDTLKYCHLVGYYA
uniref:Uncharacterized protein n=1 Tax=Arundo donax TaxID=35708 RepID=A0A0A8ZX59_ARUDO